MALGLRGFFRVEAISTQDLAFGLSAACSLQLYFKLEANQESRLSFVLCANLDLGQPI